jgi:phosphoenolpyruvate carboxylase
VRRQELRLIAGLVENANVHARLERVRLRLEGDYLLLREALTEADAIEERSGAAPDAEDRKELALLHALRLSMIHRLYFLASHIPAFTPQDGVTREDLQQGILKLEIEPAVKLLKEIFPRSDSVNFAALDFAEPATYARDAAQTYQREHVSIFEPLDLYFTMVRDVSAAITHRIGAIG